MILHPSPNCNARRHGLPPDMVVLHYTAMESCSAAVERLCDPEFEVSAHYVISEQGEIYSLVPESMRAWHAGVGAWGNVEEVNSHSIGIELVNAGPLKCLPPFPEKQMSALETLLPEILDRWSIPPERVIGHSDMAPNRKIDPGPKFDWQRLAKQNLSIWPTEGQGDFRQHALTFGYRPPEDTDAGWQSVLDTFRLRFRPHAHGPICAADSAIMSGLASQFPCKTVDLGRTSD